MVLFLNNYRSTGIGDFGGSLFERWTGLGYSVSIEETNPSGKGFHQQVRRIARTEEALVTNVGLTGWGQSGFRNFIGFRAISSHCRAGRTTVSILHHSIESFALEDTGYNPSSITRWGAHLALRHLKNCRLIVFSPRLGAVLEDEYQMKPDWITPLPCNACSEPAKWSNEQAVIATVGYWAPYKGIDFFLDAAQALGHSYRWILAGKPHRVLSEDSAFRTRVAGWEGRARQLGVSTPGYLSPSDLSRELDGRAIGVLPYSSASGASAAFTLFAERGIPVVASDLPEFRYLKELGAGITLIDPRGGELSRTLEYITSSSSAWSEMSRMQKDFSERYSWEKFVERLAPMVG